MSPCRANTEACAKFLHLLSCPDPGAGECDSAIVGGKAKGQEVLGSWLAFVLWPLPLIHTLAEAVFFLHELRRPPSLQSVERPQVRGKMERSPVGSQVL